MGHRFTIDNSGLPTACFTALKRPKVQRQTRSEKTDEVLPLHLTGYFVNQTSLPTCSTTSVKSSHMPRYLVEQIFPETLAFCADPDGRQYWQAIAENNAQENVIWLHAYISLDKRKAFCVCAAPNPEAIRRAARRNKLPVGRITEVRFLTPDLSA